MPPLKAVPLRTQGVPFQSGYLDYSLASGFYLCIKGIFYSFHLCCNYQTHSSLPDQFYLIVHFNYRPQHTAGFSMKNFCHELIPLIVQGKNVFLFTHTVVPFFFLFLPTIHCHHIPDFANFRLQEINHISVCKAAAAVSNFLICSVIFPLLHFSSNLHSIVLKRFRRENCVSGSFRHCCC